MAYSSYFMERAWYARFLPRRYAGGQPAIGLVHLRGRARLGSAPGLQSIGVPIVPAHCGKQRPLRCVLRGALVRCWTEVTVPRSS